MRPLKIELPTLHRHASPEDGADGQVAAVTGVTGGHHVLGVKDLLGELWHGQGAVLLASSRREGSEPGHEEVQTWEGHHVDCNLPQVSIELTC